MQPDYGLCEFKLEARVKGIEMWKHISGLNSIPIDKQYITLCNVQNPDCEGTEIVQLKNMGVISSYSQFIGIDRDQQIIDQNRIWIPEATWICEEWSNAIRKIDNFNPALIYMDLTSWVCSDSVLDIIDSTLHLCPIYTVLLINVMTNNPRSNRIFDNRYIIDNLPKTVPPSEMAKWSSNVHNFTYNASGKTEMRTFLMFKKKD